MQFDIILFLAFTPLPINSPSRCLKEQRLRYLKQQERRQQQTVSESEKLQRLKERVESQEAKLKKIRAMRGQVDYSKVINGNLCMYAYFQCVHNLIASHTDTDNYNCRYVHSILEVALD